MIVGHSLGGGAASLMSLFLQQTYPNTCCCYDPPGETMSPSIREQSTQFATTTVFGNDIFPRVSSYTISLLQDNIVGALANCKLSKLQFFFHVLFNRLRMKTTFFKEITEASIGNQEILSSWLQSVRIYNIPIVIPLC